MLKFRLGYNYLTYEYDDDGTIIFWEIPVINYTGASYTNGSAHFIKKS